MAKMASDFEKPNKVHTLFMNEIEEKMWPLPVSDLFMVGKASSKTLMEMGIKTIGDLAKIDVNLLRRRFKSQGDMMHEFANGIDYSNVESKYGKSKSISVTDTLDKDIEKKSDFRKILLKQAERVGKQARRNYYDN